MSGIDLTNRKSQEELKKLPSPSNENLEKLFLNIDKIVIKDDGVYDNRAMSDEIVLTILGREKISTFQRLLELDESHIGFYCMCLGSYAIELHSKNKIRATIGFHHGKSIRYDKWNSDVGLYKSDELACFLYEEGLEEPLLDKIEERKNIKARIIIEDDWLSAAPECFAKYWEEMNGFDEDYLPLLIADFKKEFPDKNLQIINLLQVFGLSSNFWTAFSIYEMVPFEILKIYQVQEIISAYNKSNKNHRIRKGLGRFLCFFEFKKTRKKYLKYIPQGIIDEIKMSFKLNNDLKGLAEIKRLDDKKNKANH